MLSGNVCKREQIMKFTTMVRSLVIRKIIIPKNIFFAFDRLMQWEVYDFDYDRDAILELVDVPEEVLCYMYVYRDELLEEFLLTGKSEVKL
jgi:hypothetical protein